MEKKEDKTLTVKQFSEEYDIGINKAYEMANAKGFPCIRVGKKILIIRSKLDNWLEDNIGKQF